MSPTEKAAVTTRQPLQGNKGGRWPTSQPLCRNLPTMGYKVLDEGASDSNGAPMVKYSLYNNISQIVLYFSSSLMDARPIEVVAAKLVVSIKHNMDDIPNLSISDQLWFWQISSISWEKAYKTSCEQIDIYLARISSLEMLLASVETRNADLTRENQRLDLTIKHLVCLCTLHA